MNHSVRRINRLAMGLNAQRYLEIGVNTGATFHNVQIKQRVGVDPNFEFDTQQFETDTTRFSATTSDVFFQSEPFFPLYDVVFIDGLHVFEQVIRDFSNAILHTHRRSVILLDDTVPNDIFSSLRSQSEALAERQAAGLNGAEWHGDVFKSVFYIHDFWPSLNYCTIIGSGNPQTLVWNAKSKLRKPIFDRIEKISRMDYFDLQKNTQIINEMEEDGAISLCLAEISAL